jgi:CRP-like cAMP-binding protein
MSPSDLATELARTFLFEACALDRLEAIARQASVHERERGACIVARNEPFPYLGYVRDGMLGIMAEGGGPIRGVRRSLLYEALAGSTFGEVGLLDRQHPLGEACVLSKRARFALIPAAAVAALAADDPTVSHRLGVAAARHAREVAWRIRKQHGWPVSARVARVLLRFASDGPGLHPTNQQLADLTQRDLAAAAGCVTEAAARAIAALEREGAVRREHGRIRYADRERLRRHCERT